MDSKWMLPRMEVLDLSTTITKASSTLALVEELILLSSERLKDPDVANLRSITISIFTDPGILPEAGGHDSKAATEQLWHDCCLNALCVLVPEVQFAFHTTATVTKARCYPTNDRPRYHRFQNSLHAQKASHPTPQHRLVQYTGF